MISKAVKTIALLALMLVCACAGCARKPEPAKNHSKVIVVTSDTILSGMAESLLPEERYSVEAILPPGQCPGHYDIKLSDVRKMKDASLVLAFRGMTFMEKAGTGAGKTVLVDAADHNWMSPGPHIQGLGILAGKLAARFPDDRGEITRRKETAVAKIKSEAERLERKISRAGLSGKPVIASSMQKEPLEWMGFKVVAEYGRPEAITTKGIARIVETGRRLHAVIVVDNLQSGSDAGVGIAEALGAPHAVLTNFPSDSGYTATLKENVDALLSALKER